MSRTTKGGQICGAQHVVTGVTVTCYRTKTHDGPHSSTTYGTRWRDSGEVLPPPATSTPRPVLCDTASCTLWRDHAGPHGEQVTLL